VTSSVIISGQAYLQSAQTEEGGFSYDPNASWGNVADANSTAYSLQALAALGMSAPDQAIDFLLGLQGEDGSLGWQVAQPAPNMGSTQQAIPALLGQPYPLRRAALPVCK
jgi:Prenyltransferase and squalene oxidase repeat